MAEDSSAPDDVQQLLSVGISATERGEYASALQLLRRAYELIPPASAPLGLSYYGLCIAKAERKSKVGAELCQKAIELQFYEGKHWANLVRVYIAAKSRRKAVHVLEEGLRKLRNDSALIRVREEIGYRKAPYFRFLSRQNPLNKVYSRSAVKLRRRGRIIVILVASVIYIAFLVAVFFAVLK
jgi:tetratricopeptide (TPR) repeat protein